MNTATQTHADPLICFFTAARGLLAVFRAQVGSAGPARGRLLYGSDPRRPVLFCPLADNCHPQRPCDYDLPAYLARCPRQSERIAAAAKGTI